jgi:hypothetical protein
LVFSWIQFPAGRRGKSSKIPPYIAGGLWQIATVGTPTPIGGVDPRRPAVMIPIMTQHYAMLQRNLLYTGITRGKRLVILVGQKKAVAIAVRNVSGRRRWSKLDEWLRPLPRQTVLHG